MVIDTLLHLPQAVRDAAYDNTRAVASSAQQLAAFEARSLAVVQQHAADLDVAYGPGARQRLDYFHGPVGAPTLLFIHGGYWQMRHKNSFRFVVQGALQQGVQAALIGYTLAVVLMATAFTGTMMSRVPPSVEVIRDRNVLFREVEYGLVENVYTLRIANMDQAAHDYVIDVTGDLDVTLHGETEISLEEGEVRTAVVRLRIDPGELPQPTNDIGFVVRSTDGTLVREASSRFIGPRVY